MGERLLYPICHTRAHNEKEKETLSWHIPPTTPAMFPSNFVLFFNAIKNKKEKEKPNSKPSLCGIPLGVLIISVHLCNSKPENRKEENE